MANFEKNRRTRFEKRDKVVSIFFSGHPVFKWKMSCSAYRRFRDQCFLTEFRLCV